MSNSDGAMARMSQSIRAWILRRVADGPVTVSELMVECPNSNLLASCLYDLEDEGLVEPTIHMRSPAYRTPAT